MSSEGTPTNKTRLFYSKFYLSKIQDPISIKYLHEFFAKFQEIGYEIVSDEIQKYNKLTDHRIILWTSKYQFARSDGIVDEIDYLDHLAFYFNSNSQNTRRFIQNAQKLGIDNNLKSERMLKDRVKVSTYMQHPWHNEVLDVLTKYYPGITKDQIYSHFGQNFKSDQIQDFDRSILGIYEKNSIENVYEEDLFGTVITFRIEEFSTIIPLLDKLYYKIQV